MVEATDELRELLIAELGKHWDRDGGACSCGVPIVLDDWESHIADALRIRQQIVALRGVGNQNAEPTTPAKKNWGMGSVVRGAGGSLGQTRSSEVFDDAPRNARRLRENAPGNQNAEPDDLDKLVEEARNRYRAGQKGTEQ